MSSAPQKGWALLVEGGKRDGVIPPGPTVPVLAFATEAERDEAAAVLAAWGGVVSAPGATDMERALHAEVTRLAALVREGGASRLAEFTAIREAITADNDRLRTRLAEAERLLGELLECADSLARGRFLQGESKDGT